MIFAGGDAPLPGSVAGLGQPGLVVAADSGMDHALGLGVDVDVLVGDLDSVSGRGLDRARAAGVRVAEHPSEKDETDLELAVREVLTAGARRLTVVGGHGGRLDHLLANVALLASPALAGVEVRALMGPAAVSVVRSRTVLTGRPGEVVSLLALLGDAGGVTTTGLRYALRGERLSAGSPRGVSNQFLVREAVVTIGSGTLVAVQPEAYR